jgi:pimeloyl-ACP methyl ester carboxylesterase
MMQDRRASALAGRTLSQVLRLEVDMATFVLVPGAWLGGWCWQRVTPGLRAAGHAVYTPTLTGLGERVHLARPEVDLDTHIQDVVNVLEYEDLREVFLIGHSYSGMVVTSVVDRVPERVRRLVYLDAMTPQDAQAFFDFWSPEGRAAVEAEARAAGEGWRWPMPSDQQGLDDVSEADRRWLRAKAAPQPLGTFSQPARLTNPAGFAVPRAYILCTLGREHDPVPALIRQMSAELGWELREIATGHWPMISAPVLVVEVLLELA